MPSAPRLPPIELLRPGAILTPQVAGVVAGLRAAGFEVVLGLDGSFAARREVDRGLRAVVRNVTPVAVCWLGFGGWPVRSGTLAELRAWCDTFGAPGSA